MPKKQNKEIFISRAKEKFGNKFDYSLVNYINCDTKVTIICPIHGEFQMTPYKHLHSITGCCACGGTKRGNTDDFIAKSKEAHGDFYDYSLVNYINSKEKVKIICPIHGEFLQSPNNHLEGKGCSKCNSSHLEREIRQLLINNNIEFIEQMRFEWLGLLSLDFYLPKYNTAIECQGKQHFGFGGWKEDADFEEIYKRDNIKRQLCNKNGVKLLYFSNLKIVYPYDVIEDKNLLLEEIKKE